MIGLSGSALHRAALHTVINAPLRFFTATDTGVVTNYFSQDMTLIDGELPISLLNIALEVAMCIGMAAVIATVSISEGNNSPLPTISLSRGYLPQQRTLLFFAC